MDTGFWNSPYIGVVVVAIVFGIIGLIVAIVIKIENNRKQKLKDYCEKNNFIYSESAENIPKDARSFSLINTENSTYYYAEISGTQGDYGFSLFDYSYSTGYGKRRQTYNNTICVVFNKKVKMPQFFMRDENCILDSLGKIFGGQDINFDEDPTFSKMYVLQGKSEPQIREFFNDNIRNAFVKHHTSGFKYEGNKSSFMVSVPKKLSLEKRLDLLAKATDIYDVIASETNDEEIA